MSTVHNVLLCAYIKPSQSMLDNPEPMSDLLDSEHDIANHYFQICDNNLPANDFWTNFLISQNDIGVLFRLEDQEVFDFTHDNPFINIDENLINKAKSDLYNDFLQFEKDIQKLYPDFKLEIENIGFGLLNYWS